MQHNFGRIDVVDGFLALILMLFGMKVLRHRSLLFARHMQGRRCTNVTTWPKRWRSPSPLRAQLTETICQYLSLLRKKFNNQPFTATIPSVYEGVNNKAVAGSDTAPSQSGNIPIQDPKDAKQLAILKSQNHHVSQKIFLLALFARMVWGMEVVEFCVHLISLNSKSRHLLAFGDSKAGKSE